MGQVKTSVHVELFSPLAHGSRCLAYLFRLFDAILSLFEVSLLRLLKLTHLLRQRLQLLRLRAVLCCFVAKLLDVLPVKGFFLLGTVLLVGVVLAVVLESIWLLDYFVLVVCGSKFTKPAGKRKKTPGRYRSGVFLLVELPGIEPGSFAI